MKPKRITIPFRADLVKEILNGKKRATARFKKYGQVGDYFVVDNKTFRLAAVSKLPLGLVATQLFDIEGCDSPEHFWKIWNAIHPKRNSPDEIVYVHLFSEELEFGTALIPKRIL